MSARPDLVEEKASTRWFNTVSACPTTRAAGSVGRKVEPGTTPAMRHSSSASEVVPVRSPKHAESGQIKAAEPGFGHTMRANYE